MSLIAATLGIGKFRWQHAGRIGGCECHRRLRIKTDNMILDALKRHGPMRANDLAARTGYKGWSGIRGKLSSMIKRELITKRDKFYYLEK